jgi:hypothetical protein
MLPRGELYTMLLLSRTQYRLEERGGIVFVLSAVTLLCPVCGAVLTAIGRRLRSAIAPGGEKTRYKIRRMRCTNDKCRKIHHELPDIIAPYKRHCAETIENIISGELDAVPCDSSTIWRIKSWWGAMSAYFTAILNAFAARLESQPPKFPTFREIIQAVANSNSWTFPGKFSGISPGVTSQPVRR